MASGDTVYAVLAHYQHGLITGVYSTYDLAVASVGDMPCMHYEIVVLTVDAGTGFPQTGDTATVTVGTATTADALRPGNRFGQSKH